MKGVTNYLNQDTTNGLAALIYGNTDPKNTIRLQGLDALSVLNFVVSKIPDNEYVLGLPDYGLDTELEMVARYLDVPLGYVESPEEQFSFFKKVSATEFSEVIESAFMLVQNEAEAKKYQRSLLSTLLYAARGNEKELLQAVEIKGFVGYNQKILFDRNESLSIKVNDIINNSDLKTRFIAIGAVHLPGDSGVIARLTAHGIKAKRICD